jgi:thiol-disulfide isomerase/thioredoxin
MGDAILAGSPASSPPHAGRFRRATVIVALFPVIAVGTLLVMARGASSDWPAAGSIEVEQIPAADFAVSRIPSGILRLSEFAGGPVVLNLWASWCTPCRAEMPSLDRAAIGHPGVSFVGVAVEDDAAAARDFADEVAVSYPLGIDDGQVLDDYPVTGLPTTWFIDEDGTIVGQVIGEMNEPEIDSYLRRFFGR